MPGAGIKGTHVGGAGTSCNQRIERIEGTEHAKILRVPFRSKAGILRKWISRRAYFIINFMECTALVTLRCLAGSRSSPSLTHIVAHIVVRAGN